MWFSCFILFQLLILVLSGDDCPYSLELGGGVCTKVTECEPAIKSIRETSKHDFFRCGFEGAIEIVCCPKYQSSISTTDDEVETKKQTNMRVADRVCAELIKNYTPPLSNHIIGGTDASIGEFPHMVALGYESQDDDERSSRDRRQTYKFKCGGSLISDRFVLTAAHCVVTLENIPPTIARTGVIDIGPNTFNSETDVRISQIIKHPTYLRRIKYHDIALIKLRDPIGSSSPAQPACLYTENDDPKMELTVTGWGLISNTKELYTNILQKANVSIVPNIKCSKSYKTNSKLPNGLIGEQLCAGGGQQDSCQGDSGGPLQGIPTDQDSVYRIIGVISYGNACASTSPGVYTRVSSYLDWIEDIVWPNY